MTERPRYSYSHLITQTPVMSTAGYAQNISTNFSSQQNFSEQTEETQIIRIIFIVAYFLIFIIGTIGNALVFVIMQRGSLKHSSTCFYMAMLVVADSCEFLHINFIF